MTIFYLYVQGSIRITLYSYENEVNLFLPWVHTSPLWKQSCLNMQINMDNFEYGPYKERFVFNVNTKKGEISIRLQH